MNRREFLKLAGLSVLAIEGLFACESKAIVFNPSDKQIFERVINYSFKSNFQSLPLNELVLQVGKQFIGTPYVAGTLDRSYPEQLVINLREFDCMTFLESTLAIAKCIQSQRSNFQNFAQELQFIRYRGGKLQGYASRLHYFNDWLRDGEKKNLFRRIIGPNQESKELYLLSKNLKYKNETAIVQQMEKEVSQEKICGFNCGILSEANTQKYFESGDILGFVSNLPGLDFNHVGFLVQRKDDWTFMHASSINKQVEIYKGTLAEYCPKVKSNKGIALARLM